MNSKRYSLMVLVLIVCLGVSGCKTVDSEANKDYTTFDVGTGTYVYHTAGVAGEPVSAKESVPSKPGIVDVMFVAKYDGTEQKYVMIIPQPFDPDKVHDVLIALHGHGSDRWQFITAPFGQCLAPREVAADHGMIYVTPDYRATTSWMNAAAEADVVQIIAELKAKYRVGKVFIAGGSMGGSSCLTFAAIHPELIDGVASLNGMANYFEYVEPDFIQQAIRESFGGTKAEIPLEYKKRSAEYWPERFTMPVGFTAGGRDTTVPPDSVLRLANTLEILGRDVLLIYQKDGGHETNYDDTRAVLEFVIQKAGKTNKE